MRPEVLPIWRRAAARVAAAAVILVLYAASLPPSIDPDERASLARRFSFSAHRLAEWPEGPYRTRRPVNPAFERHASWISAVGAAVALADADGDGLANDVCQVDPRTDRVTVAPAPSTGPRYEIFELSLASSALHWDAGTMAPMGCVPADVDEDGRLDWLVYYWGRPPALFVRSGGPDDRPRASHWIPRPLAPEAEDERWYTQAAVFSDLDGDGHLDLLIGNYFADGARILDVRASERDSMQHSMSRAYNGGLNRIFRWVAPSTFERVEGLFESRVDSAWTLAIGVADLDGDLLPEIYYANDFGPDRLFHNRSKPGALRFALVEAERTFTKPRSKVLGRDSFKGMGVDFADLNGDGMLDLFVSNIAADYALHESHFLFVSDGDPRALASGVAPYEDLSEQMGVARSSWAWDTRFGDFDNDGVPEMLQATGFKKGETDRWPELQELATANDEILKLAAIWPRVRARDDLSGHASNPFYVRHADGRYYDIAADLGIAAPQVTRGIATADVDGDGDLDFVVANQWEPSYLFRNDRPARGRDFLGLHLRLPAGDAPAPRALVKTGLPDATAPTRPAIGAEARVTRPGRAPAVAQVDGGNGHSGVRSPELHFGLGERVGPEVEVSIRYRDRRGRPAQLELELRPGWHTVVLPDAPDPAQTDTGELRR